MRKTRFTEAHVIGIPKQAETGRLTLDFAQQVRWLEALG